VSLPAAVLAEALLRQGDEREADTYARLAEQKAWPDSMLEQVPWRACRARLLLGAGDVAEAETLARAAVAWTEPGDNLNLRGDALLVLGEALAAAGESAGASAAAAEALAAYERKGNLAAAARVTRDPVP
jgi:MalT-like TPR region